MAQVRETTHIEALEEKQLDVTPLGYQEELDLRELWNVIWKGRKLIIVVTILFTIVSLIYAITLPNIYRSKVILAPSVSSDNAMSNLASQYGGLAAMAGISLGGGGSNEIDQALVLLHSWPFLESFINDNDLKKIILASKRWDKESGVLEIDSDVFDVKGNEWKIEAGQYSSWITYEKFLSNLSVERDKDTGFIKISIEHISPLIAKQWTEMLTNRVNLYFQNAAINNAKKSIQFLEEKEKETAVAEMKSVFYSLIEVQTKTLMMASLDDEYLLKVVVPAKIAEEKTSPKRGGIVILGMMLGAIAGLLIILFSYLRSRL